MSCHVFAGNQTRVLAASSLNPGAISLVHTSVAVAFFVLLSVLEVEPRALRTLCLSLVFHFIFIIFCKLLKMFIY